MSAFVVYAIAVAAVVLGWFVFDQQRRGRFRGAPPLSVERSDIDALVTSIPAEVASAALHDIATHREVEAILARLMLERKITAERVDGRFRLRLLVPRGEFRRGYEAELIRVLFVEDAVDREPLIRYWKERHTIDPHAQYDVTDLPELLSSKTFDPAEEINDSLLQEAHAYVLGRTDEPRPMFGDLAEGYTPQPAPRAKDVMSWVYGAFIAFGAHERAQEDNDTYTTDPLISMETNVTLLAGIAMHVAAMWLAERVRRKPSIGVLDVLLFPLPLFALAAFAATRDAKFLLAVLYAGSMINAALRARSGATPEHADMRHRLALVRDVLAREMKTSPPANWLPWLFAFGVADNVEFRGPDVAVFEPAGGVAAWRNEVAELTRPFVSRQKKS